MKVWRNFCFLSYRRRQMLQQQYEKHNLEMQPYRHYLAGIPEYGSKGDQAGIWKSHLTKIPGLFPGESFWRKAIRSAIRVWRSTAWMKRTARQFCARRHPCENTAAPLFYGRRFYGGLPEIFCPIATFPGREVYYRQFYGRCIMRLARMFGTSAGHL